MKEYKALQVQGMKKIAAEKGFAQKSMGPLKALVQEAASMDGLKNSDKLVNLAQQYVTSPSAQAALMRLRANN